jgi:hypothetical protein
LRRALAPRIREPFIQPRRPPALRIPLRRKLRLPVRPLRIPIQLPPLTPLL